MPRLQAEAVESLSHPRAHKASFSYNDAVADLIGSPCTELESGGRMIVPS